MSDTSINLEKVCPLSMKIIWKWNVSSVWDDEFKKFM